MKKTILPALCLASFLGLTAAERQRQNFEAPAADIALLQLQAENAVCISSRAIMQSLLDNSDIFRIPDEQADKINEGLESVGKTDCADERVMWSYFTLSSAYGTGKLEHRLDGSLTHFGDLVNLAKGGLDTMLITPDIVDEILVRIIEDQRAVFSTFIDSSAF